jgi:two-component system response regulator TctD
VRALARRPGAARTAADGSEALAAVAPAFCGLRVDTASGAVHLDGEVMDLTVREAALLRALLARPGHAVARERLVELVFPGQADVLPEAIEVVVYRLRKKLQRSAASLVTLRGLGYLLKAQPEHG